LTTDAAGPFPVNAIIQGQLTVRHSDLHPIEQHLKVQGENGVLDYALTEKAFEVLPLSELPPMLFADLTPRVSPKVEATVPVPPPIPVPRLVPTPSQVKITQLAKNAEMPSVAAFAGVLSVPVGINDPPTKSESGLRTYCLIRADGRICARWAQTVL
jgi:hypothetical protein